MKWPRNLADIFIRTMFIFLDANMTLIEDTVRWIGQHINLQGSDSGGRFIG